MAGKGKATIMLTEGGQRIEMTEHMSGGEVSLVGWLEDENSRKVLAEGLLQGTGYRVVEFGSARSEGAVYDLLDQMSAGFSAMMAEPPDDEDYDDTGDPFYDTNLEGSDFGIATAGVRIAVKDVNADRPGFVDWELYEFLEPEFDALVNRVHQWRGKQRAGSNG